MGTICNVPGCWGQDPNCGYRSEGSQITWFDDFEIEFNEVTYTVYDDSIEYKNLTAGDSSSFAEFYGAVDTYSTMFSAWAVTQNEYRALIGLPVEPTPIYDKLKREYEEADYHGPETGSFW